MKQIAKNRLFISNMIVGICLIIIICIVFFSIRSLEKDGGSGKNTRTDDIYGYAFLDQQLKVSTATDVKVVELHQNSDDVVLERYYYSPKQKVKSLKDTVATPGGSKLDGNTLLYSISYRLDEEKRTQYYSILYSLDLKNASEGVKEVFSTKKLGDSNCRHILATRVVKAGNDDYYFMNQCKEIYHYQNQSFTAATEEQYNEVGGGEYLDASVNNQLYVNGKLLEIKYEQFHTVYYDGKAIYQAHPNEYLSLLYSSKQRVVFTSMSVDETETGEREYINRSYEYINGKIEDIPSANDLYVPSIYLLSEE